MTASRQRLLARFWTEYILCFRFASRNLDFVTAIQFLLDLFFAISAFLLTYLIPFIPFLALLLAPTSTFDFLVTGIDRMTTTIANVTARHSRIAHFFTSALGCFDFEIFVRLHRSGRTVNLAAQLQRFAHVTGHTINQILP